MKKEDIRSLIIYLLLIAAAIICASTVLEDAFLYYTLKFDARLFALLMIVAAIIFNSVMLEVFHTIGAKVGGYEVVSVNVFGFCFEKREGQWKFKFKDFNGLTGETIVNKKKEKSSMKPYIWLPIIAYVVEFILMLVLYNIADNPGTTKVSAGWLAPFSIIFIVVSSMIALYNIVPFKLDTMTDGYRMYLTSKKENVEAFDELMRIENLARSNGKIENIKTFNQINDFTANLNLYSVFEDIFNKKYDKAIKTCDQILEHEEEIDQFTFYKTIAEKIYCLIQQDKIEEAKDLYNAKKGDKFRRYIANDKSIETLRCYVLIAAFIEESESEVIYCASKKTKALSEAYPSRAAEEKVLFENAIEKIYKAFPNWGKNKDADQAPF